MSAEVVLLGPNGKPIIVVKKTIGFGKPR